MKISVTVKGAVITATGTIAAALVAYAGGLINSKPNALPEPKFRINNFSLLDETKHMPESPCRIKSISNRINSGYDITDKSNLVVAFCFTAENYQSLGKEVAIEGDITFTRRDNNESITVPLHHLNNVENWKRRPTVVDIGEVAVANYFRLDSTNHPSPPIPYVVVLNDIEEKYIPEGISEIKVRLRDKLGTNEKVTELTYPITIKQKN